MTMYGINRACIELQFIKNAANSSSVPPIVRGREKMPKLHQKAVQIKTKSGYMQSNSH